MHLEIRMACGCSETFHNERKTESRYCSAFWIYQCPLHASRVENKWDTVTIDLSIRGNG